MVDFVVFGQQNVKGPKTAALRCFGLLWHFRLGKRHTHMQGVTALGCIAKTNAAAHSANHLRCKTYAHILAAAASADGFPLFL